MADLITLKFDDAHGAHVVVEHFVDGVGDRRIRGDGGDFGIAELQEIHGDLRTELAQKDWGIMNLGMLKSRKLAGLRENSDGMCS